MRKLRFDRIFMAAVFLAVAVGFFSVSDPLSPFTLITIPLGVIFLSAAVGAAFGDPDRGARLGMVLLSAFLAILALTGNGAASLAITVLVALAVYAFRFWHRRWVP